jgi:hypothetical protein
MAPYRQRNQAVQHIGVAADVPARLQPDLVVHEADGPHTGEVGRIEAAGEQPRPMYRLGLLQVGDLVPDQLLQPWDGDNMLIEPIEDFGQIRLDCGPECREQRTCRQIKLHEAQSDGKIVFV